MEVICVSPLSSLVSSKRGKTRGGSYTERKREKEGREKTGREKMREKMGEIETDRQINRERKRERETRKRGRKGRAKERRYPYNCRAIGFSLVSDCSAVNYN